MTFGRPLRSDWEEIEREVGRRLQPIATVRPDPQPAAADDPYYAKYSDEAIALADERIAAWRRQVDADPKRSAHSEQERTYEERRLEELRASMIGTGLCDAVALFAVSFARRPRRPEFGALEVTDLLPAVDTTELYAAQASAIALVSRAPGYGDRLLAGDRAVRTEMRDAHPEFSESVLNTVLDYGCYVMR